RRHVGQRVAGVEPQLQHEPLHLAVLGGELLAGVRGGAALGQALRVRGGVLDVPPAGAADVAVGAGADGPPVAAGPVEEVVAAAGGVGGRPVGHLVPAEARLAQHLVGDQVAVGGHVVVGHGQLAAADPGGQAGAVLDDERVGGDMVGLGLDGGGQGGAPVVVGLAG